MTAGEIERIGDELVAQLVKENGTLARVQEPIGRFDGTGQFSAGY